jgi:hypothetical protein
MLEIHLTGEDEEEAELAAGCLRDCCAALSGGRNGLDNLAELVLQEERWTAWMAELQELAALPGLPSAKSIGKTASSVNAACRALSAVAGE